MIQLISVFPSRLQGETRVYFAHLESPPLSTVDRGQLVLNKLPPVEQMRRGKTADTSLAPPGPPTGHGVILVLLFLKDFFLALFIPSSQGYRHKPQFFFSFLLN